MTDLSKIEAKHTPGPWTAKGQYVFAGPDCIGICDTDNASVERCEANARLMAAAPDLLEALRTCIAMIDASMEHQPFEEGLYEAGVTDVELQPGGGYMLSQARAAIAKTEA